MSLARRPPFPFVHNELFPAWMLEFTSRFSLVRLRIISLKWFYLAFCVVALPLPVVPGSQSESPLKSAHETGMMFVPNSMGNLLNRHIADYKQVRGFP